MGKKSPTPPPPPDPVAIGNAQSEANLNAVYASADINSYNQFAPWGSVTYKKDSRGVPKSQHIRLSPSQQEAYDKQQQIALGLMDRAGGALGNLPGEAWEGPGQFQPGDFNYSQPSVQDFTYDEFQGDPDAYNQRTSDLAKALYNRRMDLIRPEFERQNEALRQTLSNRGLPETGEAYGVEQERMRRAQHEAMLGAANDATMSASAEERALRALDLGQNQQAYGQALGAHGQNYNQAMQLAGQDMSAQRQELEHALATQQQLTADSLLARNQPYQEMLSYVTGAPMGPAPQAPQLPGYQTQPVDMAGLYGMQYQGQMNNYNAALQQQQAANSGLFGLGSSVIGLFSDERLKENIQEIGELNNGAKVYSFNFKGQDEPQVGFIAQQIEQVLPDAVLPGEYKRVNYHRVVEDAAQS